MKEFNKSKRWARDASLDTCLNFLHRQLKTTEKFFVKKSNFRPVTCLFLIKATQNITIAEKVNLNKLQLFVMFSSRSFALVFLFDVF